VMAELEVIFAIGAGLLVVATAIGTRLPRGQLAKTAGEQLGHVDQPV
jgi:hypothetical protein